MSDLELRKVIKAPDVLLQDLEGEAVLLNLANGLYYGLDENSYHMYKTLIASPSVQEAYEALCKEYRVEPAQLKSDLDLFLTQLIEQGLLIDVSNPAQ
jgi:hypothetical protein